MVRNLGEGIAIFGIMIGVGLTENYWLLFFLIMPLWTWLSTDEKVKGKLNEFYYKKQELEIQKLQEELRLLKLKKK